VRVSKFSPVHRFSFLLVLFSALVLATLFWSPLPHQRVDAKGAKAPPLPMQANNPGIVGQWNSTLIPFKTVPLHISLLPNGKLLYWGRDKMTNPVNGNLEDVRGHSNTYVVDPLFFFNDPIGHTSTFINSTTNLFCSGHSFLSDGRLIVTGGHDKDDSFPYSEGLGDKSVNFFDYNNITNPWTRHSVGMSLGRWYPYNVTLPNGNVAILGGTYWFNRATPSQTPDARSNPAPERYTYVPNNEGSLAVYQQDFNPYGPVENYPLVQLAPNGKVVIAGVTNRYFDGSDTSANPQGHFTNYPFSWGSQAPGNSRYTASSVLYDVTATNGRVLVVGGNQGVGGAPVNEAHTNVTNVEQAWTTVGPMSYRRKFHTATILPDGKVMVSGGTQCPGGNNLTCPEFLTPTSGAAALKPEIWDPQNPSVWNQMAASPSGIPRLYHSMAILLPDATVLVGAGGLPGAEGEVPDVFSNFGRGFGHPDAEIFSPPYLFNLDGTPALRPSITWIQDDKIGLNQSMLVKTPDYANITQVVLVRLGSVTHGLNQDQRRIVLTFTNNNLSYSQTLNVTMPSTGNVCPPGPYMMFLMANGVPSVAKMVNIQLDPQVLDPPPPPPQSATVLSGPGVASNNDGRLQVFYRGGDNALYTIAQTSAGSSTWTTPVNLGGAILGDPAVMRGNGGVLEVVVIGAGGNLYYNKQTAPNSSTFTGFSALSGTSSLTTNLAIGQNLDGRLQLFYRGNDGAVWTIAQSAVGSTSWSAQISLGGATTDTPAVARINGDMVAFWRGTDNVVYNSMQITPNTNSWRYMGQINGALNVTAGPAAVSISGETALSVFGKGVSTDLVYITVMPPAKNLAFPQTLGGSIILTPGIGTNTDGHLDVFVLGPNQKMYQNYQLKSGWNGFQQLGGTFSTALISSPVTGLNSDGRMAVFVRSSDNALYMSSQNAAGMSAAYSLYSRITPVP
jgi:hypothetical protein